jgi:hypothetical protein
MGELSNALRVFDFGETWRSMDVQNRGKSTTLRFEIVIGRGPEFGVVEIPDLLRTDQWVHVAAVSGKGACSFTSMAP